jgi:hypothetical protein
MSQAVIDASVLPILDEALGLAEDALLAQQAEQQKVAAKERDIISLRQQLADQERVILEKVASKQTINPVDLERLFDQFESLNILTPKERVKLAGHVQRDPSLIIPIFQKAADMLAQAPSEGAGLSQEESGYKWADGKDIDGWDDL